MLTLNEKPRSRSYRIAQRIAAQYEPQVRQAFLDAVVQLQRSMDEEALINALRLGKMTPPAIANIVAGGSNIGSLMAENETFRRLIGRAIAASADASLKAVASALDVDPLTFRAVDPNSVLAALDESNRLASFFDDELAETIRVIQGSAQQFGLTPQQQAQAIFDEVGLPSNWVDAPLNLKDDILNLRTSKATRRKLSAIDKAKIRKAIKDFEDTPAGRAALRDFADEMASTYTDRLKRLRSRTIARDATTHAANEGQRLGWQQAMDAGQLPNTARRFAIITPDDRLRDTHAQIPLDNPKGVGINEPFSTPFGPMMSPPWEPNCRCGVGLLIGSNVI